jgi:16S rRNA (guanine(966)-N(2))-methyltransferase RsmD
LRIIGGSARGRRLLTPKHARIRPTADRVKESLFNILTVLRGNFTGQRVLDICAGTGNLGIEALSRGGAAAVFIDEDRDAADLISRNLALAGFADRGKLLRLEALTALKLLEQSEAPFDIIFLDPPYGKGIVVRVMDYLSDSALMDDGTTVVIETAAGEELPTRFGTYLEFDSRRYGDTALHFFARND